MSAHIRGRTQNNLTWIDKKKKYIFTQRQTEKRWTNRQINKRLSKLGNDVTC